MAAMEPTDTMGRLQSFPIDQAAGATALVLGSVGGLLLVIWKSRCLCKCRLGLSDKCYIFDCTREPPPLDAIEEPSEDEEQPALVPPKKKVGQQPEPEP